MQPQDPLSQLRDIHLPEAVGAWPPAPGWWLLALLLILAGVGLLWWWRQQRQRRRYRQRALQQLHTLQQDAGRYSLQAINQLLKQTALAAGYDRSVGSLHGEQWLQFLDRTSAGDQFTHGPGRVLASGPYQSEPPVAGEALHTLAAQWIRQHRPAEAMPC